MKLTKEQLIEMIKEEMQNEGIMDLLKKDKIQPVVIQRQKQQKKC